MGSRAYALWCSLWVVGFALAFWVGAARLAPGWLFAPLDDVFIYLDYARSTGRGHPLAYTTESGYGTGATSPLYALLLAPGTWLGQEGALVWVALVTLVSLFELCRTLGALAPPGSRLLGLVPPLVFAVPVLDWSWFSGMEAAFFGAVLGHAVAAVAQVAPAPEPARARAQAVAGAWLAALAVARPEAAPLSLALGLAAAHASGRLPLLPALVRTLAPPLAALALFAGLARAFTGEWAAAGAIRKLIPNDPYAAPLDMIPRVLANAMRLATEGLDGGLGGPWVRWLLLALGAASLLGRRTRRLGAALLAGAVAAFALVCLNATAPFQNLRYLVPTFACLLVAAWLGVCTLATPATWSWAPQRALSSGPWPTRLATALAVAFVIAALRDLPRQRDHFARACRNVAQQQVEVGRRLRALGPSRVFVGDAGAIPYVTDGPAIDGLGLGGYHDVPFARASVHGWPAVIELVEHLSPAERPDVLAIYDGWWPGLGAAFGTRLFSVRIDDNVICGDAEKVVYRADWSTLDGALDPPGALARVDVANLLDERLARLDFTRPRGGFVVAATLADEAGAPRWDAGRILAEGQALWFDGGARGVPTATLVVRTDDAPGEVEVEVVGGGLTTRTTLAPPTEPAGRWRTLRGVIAPLPPDAVITVRPTRGALRVFGLAVIEG